MRAGTTGRRREVAVAVAVPETMAVVVRVVCGMAMRIDARTLALHRYMRCAVPVSYTYAMTWCAMVCAGGPLCAPVAQHKMCGSVYFTTEYVFYIQK